MEDLTLDFTRRRKFDSGAFALAVTEAVEMVEKRPLRLADKTPDLAVFEPQDKITAVIAGKDKAS